MIDRWILLEHENFDSISCLNSKSECSGLLSNAAFHLLVDSIRIFICGVLNAEVTNQIIAGSYVAVSKCILLFKLMKLMGQFFSS